VRELPRQLDAGELERLFENGALAERLAGVDDPLGRARRILGSLTEEEKVEALSTHPPIGATHGLSTASAREQGADADPAPLAELAELNRAYEERFGFRFVVFVNRRPRAAVVPILRERLERTRAEELETGLDELVAIAIDRWRNG
jgi:2-oxo-4-hydroxy-4-carboxy-5-ureidoimidazoline decarboxylase